MNSKRRITVVAAVAILGLGLTAGWSVLAGEAWPPERYEVLSSGGAYLFGDGMGGLATVLVSPPDLRTGTGFGLVTWIVTDPTMNGLFPEATSLSQGFMSYVEIAPEAGRIKGVNYVLKDTKPRATILGIVISEGTSTMTSPDAGNHEGTLSVYSAAADKDGDGLPDAGEQPLVSFPIVGPMTRI
jgi:hypothetical protein